MNNIVTKNACFVAFSDKKKWHRLLLLLAGFIIIIPGTALASETYEISSILCSLATQLTTPTGKALATVAIIATGALALFGKSSWGSVYVIGAGIALLFGAGSIVTALGGGPDACTHVGNNPFSFGCQDGVPVAPINPATGQPYTLFDANQSLQQISDPIDSVFAHTLFFFKTTLGSIMSSMYCAMSHQLEKPLLVLFTLFIVVFGLMVVTGIVNLTIREIMVVFFKIALVWAFAMNADWGIMIGYKFFMNFAEEGTNIVLSALGPTPLGINASITAPDAVISNFFNTTNTGASGAGLPACTSALISAGTPCSLPDCTSALVSAGTPCSASLSQVPQFCLIILFILAFLLLFFMPIIIIFIVILIIGYLGSFMRAMLNYLTSLVLISFLFIFAPFFLSFALFRTTIPLFEGWIKHLISFSLQMIIMFAFMAMLTLLPVFQFFATILELLKTYDHTFYFTPQVNIANINLVPAISYTMHFCGVCQYSVAGLSLTCIPHPLGKLSVDAATAAAAQAGYMLSDDHNYWVTSLWNIVEDAEIAKYILINVIALYALSKAMRDFLHKAPELAKHLGGVASAAALGGGGTKLSGPGISYFGLESITAGYYGLKNGLLQKVPSTRNRELSLRRQPLSFMRDRLIDAPAKEWGTRIKAGFLGEKDENGNAVPNIGLVQGLMQGAYDKRTMAGRVHTNQLWLYEKKINSLQDKIKKGTPLTRTESLNLKELQRLQREAELKGAGNFKRGLFEVRPNTEKFNQLKTELKNAIKEGKPQSVIDDLKQQINLASKQNKILIHRSSLNVSDYGDETAAKVADYDNRHRARKMYGHYLKDNPGNWYYGMKMPSDVYAVDDPQRIQLLREQAYGEIQSLQSSLSTSNLPPDKKQKIQSELSSASSRLANADSAGQLDGIIKRLHFIARELR